MQKPKHSGNSINISEIHIHSSWKEDVKKSRNLKKRKTFKANFSQV